MEKGSHREVIKTFLIIIIFITVVMMILNQLGVFNYGCCYGNNDKPIPCPNENTKLILEEEYGRAGCEHTYYDYCIEYQKEYNVTLECWSNKSLYCGR